MKSNRIGPRRISRVALMASVLGFLSIPGLSRYPVALGKVVNPHCLRVHAGRVYLLQDGTVYVYACADGGFFNEFGRSGEGPGETRRFPTRGNMLRVNDQGIFIDARNKIVRFGADGRFIEEFKKPYGHFVVEPFRDGWITLLRGTNGPNLELSVTRCAGDFTVLDRYLTHVSRRTGFSLFPDQANFVVAGGSFYIENSGKGLCVSQYIGDGVPVRTLRLDRAPVKVSPGDIDFAYRELAADPETRAYGGLRNVKKMLGITIPPDFPAIKEISADPVHLFVKTFRRNAGTCEFLVFDHHGKMVGCVLLPATPPDAFDDYLTGRLDRYYAFYGDYYYYLRENEAEEHWELNRVKWTDKMITSNRMD